MITESTSVDHGESTHENTSFNERRKDDSLRIIMISLCNGLISGSLLSYGMFVYPIAQYYQPLTVPYTIGLGYMLCGCGVFTALVAEIIQSLTGWLKIGNMTDYVQYSIMAVGYVLWIVGVLIIALDAPPIKVVIAMLTLMYSGGGMFIMSSLKTVLSKIVEYKTMDIGNRILLMMFVCAPNIFELIMYPTFVAIFHDSQTPIPNATFETLRVTAFDYPQRYFIAFRQFVHVSIFMTLTGGAFLVNVITDNWSTRKARSQKHHSKKRNSISKRAPSIRINTVENSISANISEAERIPSESDVTSTSQVEIKQPSEIENKEYEQLENICFVMFAVANMFFTFPYFISLFTVTSFVRILGFGDFDTHAAFVMSMCMAAGSTLGRMVIVYFIDTTTRRASRAYGDITTNRASSIAYFVNIFMSIIGYIALGLWFELANNPRPDIILVGCIGFFMGFSLGSIFIDNILTAMYGFTGFTPEMGSMSVVLSNLAAPFLIGNFVFGNFSDTDNIYIDFHLVTVVALSVYSVFFIINFGVRVCHPHPVSVVTFAPNVEVHN